MAESLTHTLPSQNLHEHAYAKIYSSFAGKWYTVADVTPKIWKSSQQEMSHTGTKKKKMVPEISPLQKVVLCENVIFEIKGPSNWIMQ